MPSSLLALESICLVQSVYVALSVHKRVWEEGMIHQYQVIIIVPHDLFLCMYRRFPSPSYDL